MYKTYISMYKICSENMKDFSIRILERHQFLPISFLFYKSIRELVECQISSLYIARLDWQISDLYESLKCLGSTDGMCKYLTWKQLWDSFLMKSLSDFGKLR